jgi:short-subunit dehydrogenase
MSDQPRSRLRRALDRVAWGAVVLSFPVWCFAFVAPFLPLEPAQKATLAAACIAAGEGLFWGAGVFLGADVVAKFAPRRGGERPAWWRRPSVTTGESFRGKRVVVIGATGGLGSAVAAAVAREGGSLVVIGRDPTKLASLPPSWAAQTIVADVSASSLQQAASQIGEVDHVVCATGVDVRRSLGGHSDEDVAMQLSVALEGPIHVARAFLSRLRPGGTIALFGGFADGTLALPYYSVDVAARAGLAGFCASINNELAVEGRSVRLCYVCPAPADTDAERPFRELWRSMGTTMVSPARVADFVLEALLQKRTVAVMGFTTRALVPLRALAPSLIDGVIRRRMGPLLKRVFSTTALPTSSSVSVTAGTAR